MKIPVSIVCIFLSAWLGLNGWSLFELHTIGMEQAIMRQRLEDHLNGRNFQPNPVAKNNHQEQSNY